MRQTHLIQCHVKPPAGSEAKGIVMRLAISTTVIEPSWSVSGNAEIDASLGCYGVNFGMPHVQASLLCDQDHLVCFDEIRS